MSRRTYVVQATSIVAVRNDLHRGIRSVCHIQITRQHDETFTPAEVPWPILLYSRADDGVEAVAHIITNGKSNRDKVLGVAQLER